MQSPADDERGLATEPSSPRRHLCSGRDGDHDEDGGGIHYFFSCPASPVHYILRSPPASSALVHYAPSTDVDLCTSAGDFEFAARNRGVAGAGAVTTMSSAEELFVSGRIRVGCLSPIRQETDRGEQMEEADDQSGVGGRSPRPRRARSASPPRSPRLDKNAPPSGSFASESSSSCSSSSSAKTIRRRISLRDLLGRTCSDPSVRPPTPITTGTERSPGSWLPSIWPARSRKALPCPAPLPARRSTSSLKKAPGGPGHQDAPPRRTTSLPYRQGLILGCLGLGARSYGFAKSMHPLSTR